MMKTHSMRRMTPVSAVGGVVGAEPRDVDEEAQRRDDGHERDQSGED